MSDRDEQRDPWWVPVLVILAPLALLVLIAMVASDYGCAEWVTSTIRGCK